MSREPSKTGQDLYRDVMQPINFGLSLETWELSDLVQLYIKFMKDYNQSVIEYKKAHDDYNEMFESLETMKELIEIWNNAKNKNSQIIGKIQNILHRNFNSKEVQTEINSQIRQLSEDEQKELYS